MHKTIVIIFIFAIMICIIICRPSEQSSLVNGVPPLRLIKCAVAVWVVRAYMIVGNILPLFGIGTPQHVIHTGWCIRSSECWSTASSAHYRMGIRHCSCSESHGRIARTPVMCPSVMARWLIVSLPQKRTSNAVSLCNLAYVDMGIIPLFSPCPQ